MNFELEIVFAQEPPSVVLAELEVITLSREDWPCAARVLDEEHYLGDTRPVGRTLIQAVHHQGRWVALLGWGPAALKLTDRAADIGWTDSQRAERIGLVVQNRRFLVLSQTHMPNLASMQRYGQFLTQKQRSALGWPSYHAGTFRPELFRPLQPPL